MSMEEVERLRREEEELRAKVAELGRRRMKLQAEEEERQRAKEREEALRKPIVVTVKKVTGGSILIENDARPDLIEYLRSVPGRSFRGYAPGSGQAKGRNLIPIAEWDGVKERLDEMPFLTLKWDPDVERELDWYLHAPPWEIDVHPSRRHFIARMGPRQSHYQLLSHIPGADWDWDSKSWKVPLSEGWRTFEALKKVEGVVYTDDAKAIIFDQVESRAKLDKIANQEDSVWGRGVLMRPVEVNGVVKPFWQHMKKFQRVGGLFMTEAGGRTLLADATGLGKTWQALAFTEMQRHRIEDYVTVCQVKSANIPNWKREIKRLTGEDPVVCQGGQPDGWLATQILNREHPYILISHDTLGTYRRFDEDGNMVSKKDEEGEITYLWAGILKGAEPNCLIIDEAHLIKNPSSHRSKATRSLANTPHVIPMTASPVLNRTEELWPILYMLNPSMFKVHDQFINTYTFGGRTPRNVEKLHELLRPMFLRRKKADVMKELPAINRMIRYHDLSKDAEGAYKEVLRGIYHQIEHFDPAGQGGEQMSVMSILAQITRLKQVCAADKVEYTADLATELIDEAEGDEEDGKVLVFSQFKGTAHAIARRLGSEAVCTVERKPDHFKSMNADERDALFEAARHDPKVRFIVTTEAAKEGHNLEFCNWVIFNDPLWTPAAHDQCEGRAYGRLADPHPIDSFYIIAEVDVERWIMDLLDKKLQIINEAVENIEATRDVSGSIGMELIKRMKEEMYGR